MINDPDRRENAAAVVAEPARDNVRAVAFKVDERVYEGKPGETHGGLYTRLLVDSVVPAKRLDLWTAHDADHGFVTQAGEFINRAEAFNRFKITRSQELNSHERAQRSRKTK